MKNPSKCYLRNTNLKQKKREQKYGRWELKPTNSGDITQFSFFFRKTKDIANNYLEEYNHGDFPLVDND